MWLCEPHLEWLLLEIPRIFVYLLWIHSGKPFANDKSPGEWENNEKNTFLNDYYIWRIENYIYSYENAKIDE